MSKNPPSQHQEQQPGIESEMEPKPKAKGSSSPGSNKLKGKIAIITGGDSGIGRAVAYAFAKEGADIFISYLNEHEDANETKKEVEQKYGRRCICLAGDIGEEKFCRELIEKAIKSYERIDILVNNAAEQ